MSHVLPRYTFWLMLQLCYSPKTAYVEAKSTESAQHLA